MSIAIRKRFITIFRPLADTGHFWFFFLLTAGIIFRFYFALSGPLLSDQIWSDMKGYFDIAEDIGKGIWKKTHFFQSIGYPIFLAGLKDITDNYALALTLIQAFCSSLTLIFVYLTAKDTLGKRVALWSLALSSVHLPWIFYSNFALPEILFTFFLSVCAYLSAALVNKKKNSIIHSFLWAFFFGAAFTLKGTHALWGPIFLLSLLILNKKFFFKPAVVISFGVGIWLLSHGLLSYTKTGKFQMSASAGGLNFVEGKCPEKKNRDNNGFAWLSPLYFQLDMHTEKVWPRPFTESLYFMKEGLKCIAEKPLVLVQSLESIPFLFFGNTMWPFNQYRSLSGLTRIYELYMGIFLVTGLITFALDVFNRRSFQDAVVWLSPVIALFLCVYIFKSEIRYRVPFDVWLIPLSIKGWSSLMPRYRRVLPG